MGLSEQHIVYLERRKIDVEFATVKHGIRTHRHNGREWLAFPYMNGEQELYAKLKHTVSKEFLCAPGGEQTKLWNEDALLVQHGPSDPLIITEGELDCLAALQSGFAFAVSVPSGAAKTYDGARNKALKCLAVDDIVKANVAKFKRVIVLTDCDGPGLELRKAIIDILGPDVCYTPDYPAQCKDANDVLLLPDGEAKLRAMIDRAVHCQGDNTVGIADFCERVEDVPSLSTGLSWLDVHYKPPATGVTIIAGLPSSGKSTIRDFVILNLIKENPSLRVLMYNTEGDPKQPLRRASPFWAKNISPDGFRTPGARADFARWCNTHIRLLIPRQDAPRTTEWILAEFERAVFTHKTNFFVIDPFNSLEGLAGKGENMSYAVNGFFQKLTAFADRHKVHIMICHHITPDRYKANRDLPPGLTDIADSQSFSRHATNIIMPWRWKLARNETMLQFVKSKDHSRTGKEGLVWVSWTDETCVLAPMGFNPQEREREQAAMITSERKKRDKRSNGGELGFPDVNN